MWNPITTTYGIATQQTFALCLLKDDNLNRIITRIQCAQSFASNPFLPSVVLLSMDEQLVRRMGHGISRDCRKMEKTMGYDSEDDELDLERVPESSRIPQRLNRLQSRAIGLEYVCSLMLIGQNRLESQMEGSAGEYCLSVCKELREQLVYTQESLGGVRSHAGRSKDLVQAMVQTVRTLRQKIPKAARSRSQVNANLQQRGMTMARDLHINCILITCVHFHRQPAESSVRGRYATHHSDHSHLLARNICCNLFQYYILGLFS